MYSNLQWIQHCSSHGDSLGGGHISRQTKKGIKKFFKNKKREGRELSCDTVYWTIQLKTIEQLVNIAL